MTVSKIYYRDKQVRGMVHDIMRQMHKDSWIPDYIVGLNRGGLVPAVMLSHYLDVPMHCLGVSFRDGEIGPESNLWMAEDAFGYHQANEQEGLEDAGDDGAVKSGVFDYAIFSKKILIVDDINDSGKTLNWIKEDWPSGCLPKHERWDQVWHNNVRFAVLINNEASSFKEVDYIGTTVNKLDTPVWCVFPWEEWWDV